MTQIFLVRHGEAEGNLYRRAQGQIDAALTAEGRRQAAFLQPRFADISIHAAYSSDLSRAYDTACAAVEGHGIPVQRDSALREICFGEWEQQPWANLNRCYPELKEAFLHDPDRWQVPGAEGIPQARERICAAMETIARRHEGQTVLVGCHGMISRIFLAAIQGIPSERIDEVPLPVNTAVALLQYENGRFTLVYQNDASHLPKPPFVPLRTAGDAFSYDLYYEPYDTVHGREQYLNCYKDAWRIAHGSLLHFSEEGCWNSALLYAGDSPEAFTCVRLGDRFAGTLLLDEHRGAGRGIGWIAFCYIMPEFRGHRCGVQLIGAAIARYRALGRRVLRLSVAQTNPAVDFYRHLGFKAVDTAAGAFEPLLVMELPL